MRVIISKCQKNTYSIFVEYVRPRCEQHVPMHNPILLPSITSLALFLFLAKHTRPSESKKLLVNTKSSNDKIDYKFGT